MLQQKLENLSRRELQKLAKEYGIKGSIKSTEIIIQLHKIQIRNNCDSNIDDDDGDDVSSDASQHSSAPVVSVELSVQQEEEDNEEKEEKKHKKQEQDPQMQAKAQKRIQEKANPKTDTSAKTRTLISSKISHDNIFQTRGHRTIRRDQDQLKCHRDREQVTSAEKSRLARKFQPAHSKQLNDAIKGEKALQILDVLNKENVFSSTNDNTPVKPTGETPTSTFKDGPESVSRGSKLDQKNWVRCKSTAGVKFSRSALTKSDRKTHERTTTQVRSPNKVTENDTNTTIGTYNAADVGAVISKEARGLSFSFARPTESSRRKSIFKPQPSPQKAKPEKKAFDLKKSLERPITWELKHSPCAKPKATIN